MNMQQKLFLFILMGPGSILTHQNYEYHFIKENKTWDEAKNYCKENYTDLAVLDDDEDLKRLIGSTNFQGEAWIGLDINGSCKKWTRSVGCCDTNTVDQKCVLTVLNNDRNWKTDQSDAKKYFFCYDDKVILITENKTWEEALFYCRVHHRDLVTITNIHQQKLVEKRAKKASTDFVWLGLHFTCAMDLWFWISDEAVGYKNWGECGKYDQCDFCGAMESKGHNEWFSQQEISKFNFVCTVN